MTTDSTLLNNPFVSFLDSVCRGCGQVMFQNSPITGFLFFASTEIALDGGSHLTLRGVSAANLSADDFRFV